MFQNGLIYLDQAVVFGTDNEAIVFDQGKFAQGSGQGCGGMD